MRIARLLFTTSIAALCAHAQQPESKPRAHVEGRIVNAVTGAPLRKAIVRLQTFQPQFGVTERPSVPYLSTSTDAEGRFQFEPVDAGAYVVAASRNGYLEQGFGSQTGDGASLPPFRLTSGQRMTDLLIKLTPQGFLHGRVVDEDGDSMPNIEVRLQKTRKDGAAKMLISATTQDDGSFVVGNLASGRYAVCAVPQVADADPHPAAEAYVTTCFPNAIDSAYAAMVDVTGGAEVRGIEIRMQRSRVFHIRGQVVDTAKGRPASTTLQLTPVTHGEMPAANGAVSFAVGQDGRFEFAHVIPGDYRLQTNPMGDVMVLRGDGPALETPAENLVGRKDVRVAAADLEDVVVAVSKGAEITGSIVTESGAFRPAGDVKTRRHFGVVLVSTEGDPLLYAGAQVERDGTFKIDSVSPDIYRVKVNGVPEGMYIKSILAGGRDVTHAPMDLTSGSGGRIEVLLSPNAAELTGIVKSQKGDAVPGAVVRLWNGDPDDVRTVMADENGTFRLGGLAPGEYSVFGWKGPDTDPDPAGSATVKVTEGARERIELKVG